MKMVPGQACLALKLLILILPLAAASYGDQWLNHGGGIKNWRFAKTERIISVETAARLALKWEFVAGLSVSATPAIYKGVLYFPSWNGLVFAVEQETGSLLWSTNLTEVTGLLGTVYTVLGTPYTFTRATPVVSHDLLLIGLAGPAYVVALDRHTGKLVWKTLVDEHPWAILTQSGTAHKRSYYFGVSSLEELASTLPDYICCTFIGSFQKLDIRTGKVAWKIAMLPDNGSKPGQYAGVAVWGSSPAIDLARGLVYIATGNIYTAPPAIQECEQKQQNLSKPAVPDPCLEPGNLENAILALELGSGKIRWAKKLLGYDAWNVACTLPGNVANCPKGGPADDYDFGQAPMLLTIRVNSSSSVDVAVAGQKSGIVWALDRDTGDLVWDTVTGPGGYSGGVMWGSATDGKRVYTHNANTFNLTYTLLPSNKTTTGGAWVGLDAATGSILWTTPTPNKGPATGPVSVANGVVFGTASDATGRVFALDGKTGDVLWHYDAMKGSSQGGIAVSQGCAFVGSGYTNGPGTSLYAFCVE